MKKQVSIIWIVLITLLSGNFAQAQKGNKQGPPPVPDAEQVDKMVNKLADDLSLSDDQKNQVKDLYIDHFEQVRAVVEDARPDREVMEALAAEFEQNVSEVLTDEQNEIFLEQRENQKRRGGNKGGRQRPGKQ